MFFFMLIILLEGSVNLLLYDYYCRQKFRCIKFILRILCHCLDTVKISAKTFVSDDSSFGFPGVGKLLP